MPSKAAEKAWCALVRHCHEQDTNRAIRLIKKTAEIKKSKPQGQIMYEITPAALRRIVEEEKKKLEQQQIKENFGQDVVRRLEEKYIDISDYTVSMNTKRRIIEMFDEWCMAYEGGIYVN